MRNIGLLSLLAALLLVTAACSRSPAKPAAEDQTVSPEEAAQAVTVTVGSPFVRQVPALIIPRPTATVAATPPARQSSLTTYQTALFDCAGKVQALIASESNLSGGQVLDAERTLRTDPGNSAAIASVGRAVQPMRNFDQEIQAAACDPAAGGYLQLAKGFSSDELQALVLLNEGIADTTAKSAQSLQQSTQLTSDSLDKERQITAILQDATPATPTPSR